MKEITHTMVSSYLSSIRPKDSDLIEQIRKEAIEAQVPIIKNDMKGFLEVLLTLHQPKKILEIGTAVGYSSIIMSECLRDDVHIDTIERNPLMIKKARENIHRVHKEQSIKLHEGDAFEILAALEGSYDLIFLDAAKGQYLYFLEPLLQLLREGGLLVSDNVLQEGHVADAKYAIPRRFRTTHTRMREYLYTLVHHPSLKTTVQAIADGVTVSVKMD